MKELVSIIVPCFNEQEALPIFYKTIIPILKQLGPDYELILVDDGSKDNTAQIMKNLAEEDENVKYVIFSRNFGKESAMYAGLSKSKGDYVAVMDVDLQDPPEQLFEMLKSIKEEGYDCVATRRVTRKGEPKIRSWFARQFYKLINKWSQTEVVDGARDYRLMKRSMVDAILSMPEYNRFSKGIFSWVGFKTKWLEYENIERVAGVTKWNFKKLFVYALDGIIAFTSVKRDATDLGHTFGDRDARKTLATVECANVNEGHAIGERNTRHGGSPRESISANARHRAIGGDHAGSTAQHEGLGCRLNDTVIHAVIDGVIGMNLNRCQGGAALERIGGNGGHPLAHRERCKAGAFVKRKSLDEGYGIGNGHARKRLAPAEHLVADGGKAPADAHA